MDFYVKLRQTLDLIAQEGFRDIADYDYIGARVSFRLNLRDQFYWSALQAVEKYLKAILLFNGIKVKDLSHTPKKIYDRVTKKAELNISLDQDQLKLLDILGEFGNNRYRTKHSHMVGDELFEFDRLIWTIRHYARSVLLMLPSGENKTEWYAKNFRPPDEQNIPTIKQLSGELEKIFGYAESNPHRKELLWCNRYYGWKENALQKPEIIYMSSHDPIYEREWFLDKNNVVTTTKPLSAAVQDFVKFP